MGAADSCPLDYCGVAIGLVADCWPGDVSEATLVLADGDTLVGSNLVHSITGCAGSGIIGKSFISDKLMEGEDSTKLRILWVLNP